MCSVWQEPSACHQSRLGEPGSRCRLLGGWSSPGIVDAASPCPSLPRLPSGPACQPHGSPCSHCGPSSPRPHLGPGVLVCLGRHGHPVQNACVCSSLGPATCSPTLAPQALPASNSSPPNLEPGAGAGPHGRSPRPLAHSCTGRVEVSLQPRQPGLSSQDPRPAQPSWSTSGFSSGRWLLRPRHAWLELLAGPRPTAASGQ